MGWGESLTDPELTTAIMYKRGSFLQDLVEQPPRLSEPFKMFLLPLLILTFARVSSGESLFTDETLHERVATQTPWSFAGATGPLAWAGMEPQTWAACSTSKLQSPIDLDSSYKVYGSKPEFSVPVTSPMPCLYNGHTFKVNMTEAHVLTKYGGQDYSLNQFHFHTPSEHFIDGDYFPLEMHFVHHRVSGMCSLCFPLWFQGHDQVLIQI